MWSTPFAVSPWRLRLMALAGLLVATFVWLGAPSSAQAAASCTASVSSVNLGSTLSPLTAGTVDATANLNFSCTGLGSLLSYSLCPNLDAGSGGSNGAGQRYMTGPGGATVAFQVYQDAARTQPWGSSALLVFGTVPTITASPGTGTTINVNQTVYLRLTTTTTTVPGAYSTSFVGQNFFWGLNLLTCAGVTIGYAVVPATFTFSATLIPDCTISTGNLNFGNVGVLSAAKDAQTGMSVTCTKDTPYAIGLDNGQQGTSATARRMKAAGQYVTYGIYKDEARASPWGTGAGLTTGGSGTGGAQPLTLYGRVPAQTTPSPGTYGDQVIATVTY
ncbi:Csu type fimbrial protein [Caulobacter endophyticus]|uniref:Spore coat protein U/FanG domain-containing protein n=1 Tax=Caulobacter endophyticus TaxID=2172652 RepID=A0A2T9JP27_9CAUL|nr:spore coat U domain-containing protein [Caulobacter endophyticus]PVM85444.1 hypothetical protein DDF67_17715 [Caulobacter endophyticus]